MREPYCNQLKILLIISFIVKLTRIHCENDKSDNVYGLTIVFAPKRTSAVCYQFILYSLATHGVLSDKVQTNPCKTVDTIHRCIDETIIQCNFEKIPKDQIYLRFVYKDHFNYVSTQDEITNMIKKNSDALVGYYRETNYVSEELLNGRTSGFYLYFDAVKNQLPTVPDEKTKIYVGLGKSILYVGFLPIDVKYYNRKLLTYFSHKKTQHIAFSNDFSCAVPEMLKISMARSLIKTHAGQFRFDHIPHPCIPVGEKITISSILLTSRCHLTHLTEKDVTFIGDFDFSECTESLKKLHYDENVNGATEYANLFDIGPIYLPNQEHDIVFYNEHYNLDNVPFNTFMDLIQSDMQTKCVSASENENLVNDCFELATIYTFFLSALPYPQNVITAIERSLDYNPNFDKIYINGDPRIGIRKYIEFIGITSLAETSATTSVETTVFTYVETTVFTSVETIPKPSPKEYTLYIFQLATIIIFLVLALVTFIALTIIFIMKRRHTSRLCFVPKI